MLGSKRKAAELLRTRSFREAAAVLKYVPQEPEVLQWRSLLLRVEGSFEMEERIVQRALRRFPSDRYIREREAWHRRPLLEKLVPRPRLIPTVDPKSRPRAEILDKLVFVSGADSGYFSHLVQLLESVENTSLYRHMPIGILDCGLLESERAFLRQRFNIAKLVKAEWKVPPNPSTLMAGRPLCEGHKAIMNKPFLPEYFPEWQYLLWFDADSWIQDETAIDAYLRALQVNGIGISCFYADGFRHVATGVFAISKNSRVLQPWQQLFLSQTAESGFNYAYEEISLRAVLEKLGISDFLEPEQLYRIWIEGMPYVKPQDHLLYTPTTNRPLSIYAFDAHTDKSVVFWPTQERARVFEQPRELQAHKRRSAKVLLHKQHRLPRFRRFENQKMISLHYRTWPWKDRQELLDTLCWQAERFLFRSEPGCRR